MAWKELKDGASRLTEYETRSIDEYGDAVDVNHYETKAEALEHAERELEHGAAAVVVEVHVSYHGPLGAGMRDRYKTVFTKGSAAALEAGAWEVK